MAKVKANERAYSYIKERLTTNGFHEGDFLTEGVIAETLGISRTPVREALLRLEAEHLLTIIPGRGAIVPHDTERSMREVMEAREVIEAHAVSRLPVGKNGPTDQLHALLLEQQRAEIDAATFIDQDRRFHQCLVDAADNRLLSELYSSLRDRQTRMGIRAILRDATRLDTVVAEHLAIVEALERGDRGAADAAVRKHLAASLEVLAAGRE